MSIDAVCLSDNVDGTMQYLTELFLRGRAGDSGKPVAVGIDTGHWQAVKDVPQTKTIELTNVHLMFGGRWKPMPSHLSLIDGLESYFKPNLSWASDHFLERVSGEPLNPGEQFRNWPWYRSGVEDHKLSGRFSHTYMERFWPRHANDPDDPANGGSGGVVNYWEHTGIRYRYGDLNDLVKLLAREPYTRQAFLPVWFPEDTGAHHGERVPCTLGYHFMLRDDKLHIFYPIRSCDFVRYLRDDAYMAARLGLWLIDQLRARDNLEFERGETPDVLTWDSSIKLGELNMFIPSLHIFEGDVPMLQRKGMPIMRGWEEEAHVGPNQS